MTIEEMRIKKTERGYSLAQLSKLSGVPLGTVQKIFAGETRHPRYATLQALENVLATGEEALPARRDAGTYSFEDEDPINNRTGYVAEAFAHVTYGSKKQGEYTLEDYYALPDERRVELIDGVIYDMSAPDFVHQRISGKIYHTIQQQMERHGGDCVPMYAPVDVRLDCDDKTMVQPDVLILCDHSKICKWGIMGAPDFCLEILSPSTARKDCIKKLQKYTDAGVKEYWIVDPIRKVLITYHWKDEYLPHMYPLEGEVGLELYDGAIKVDLNEVAGVILEYPE